MSRISSTIIFLFCLLVFCGSVLAQSPSLNWGFGIGGIYEESLGAVAVDPAGSTVCVGDFYSEIDLGAGLQTGVGGRDFFIAKYGPDGGHVWSQVFGGLQNDSANDVVTLSDSSVVVAGAFRGTIDLGAGPMTATGITDAFLARFTSAGVLAWSVAIGGSGSQSADRLAVDSSGNLIVAGSFFTEVDFGSGPVASQGTSDVFVAKYTGAGVNVWGYGFGSAMGEDRIRVAMDGNDDLVVAGNFTLTIDFGGGDLTAAGSGSFYLAKLAGLDGSHVWSISHGGVNGAVVSAVAVDGQNDIACVGEFIGPLDLGGDILVSSGFYTDLFVAKFSSEGIHQWSHGVGSTGVEPPRDLVVDALDHIHLIGYHALGGTLDFGGGVLPDAGNGDIFLAGYMADGSYLWSTAYGDASLQTGEALAVGPANGLVLAGTFMGAPDFGGGALTNNGDADIYLVSVAAPGQESPVPFDLATRTLSLQQNVPNPFNPLTTIAFDLATAATVSLRVFDLSGSTVRTLLADEFVGSGRKEVTWDGRDDAGRGVAGGVYVYRLESDAGTETRQMVLVR